MLNLDRAPLVMDRQIPPQEQPRLVFIFGTRESNWGEPETNWIGMGQRLYDEQPVFREVLERCDREVRKHLGWSLVEEFMRDPDQSRLHISEEHMDAAMTAMHIGLSEIWRSRRVRPDAVVGDCLGGLAAAYVAGRLSLESAMEVICRVSRLIRQRLGLGRMVLIDVSLEDMQHLQLAFPEPIYLAAQLEPHVVVVSCEDKVVKGFFELLSNQGITYRMVPSEFALHSPLLEPWKDTITQPLEVGHVQMGALPVYSTSRGELIEQTTFDAMYWWEVMRRPVLQTTQTWRHLLQHGYDTFIEINSYPKFSNQILKTASKLGKKVVTLPSLLNHHDINLIFERAYHELQRLGYPLSHL